MSGDGHEYDGKGLDQSADRRQDVDLSDDPDESADRTGSGHEGSRWTSLRHHLWDPIRLRRARVFASNTSRLLSVSRSMSMSAEQAARECGDTGSLDYNPDVLDDQEQCCGGKKQLDNVVLEDSNESLPHDLSDVISEAGRGVPTKSKCLKLIDKIWSGGLGHNLEQIRQRHQRLPRTSVGMETGDGASCEKCVLAKEKLYKEDSMQPPGSKHTGVPPVGSEICDRPDGSGNSEGNSDEHKPRLAASEQALIAGPPPECSTSLSPKHDQSHTVPGVGSRSVGTKSAQDLSALMSSGPPFKKARFSWQVKNKNNDGVTNHVAMVTESPSCGMLSGSLMETDSVAKAVEEVVKNYDSQSRSSDLVSMETGTDDADVLIPPSSDSEVVEIEHEVLHSARSNSSPRAEPEQQPNQEDFQELSEALTQLNYVERWQCQHVAKAIVDNAINKTLEEMGLSPNDNGTVYREQRTRIEDAGVSQAILSQGLRRYSPNSYRMRRLNPIINRLTRVSEDLFSENLRGTPSVDDQSDDEYNPPIAGPGGLVTSDMMDVYINFEESLSSSDSDGVESNLQHAEVLSPRISITDLPEVDLPHDDVPLITDVMSGTMAENVSVQALNDATVVLNGNPDSNTSNADSHDNGLPLPAESSEIPVGNGSHHMLRDGINSKFLDEAVNAVICERGLQFRDIS